VAFDANAVAQIALQQFFASRQHYLTDHLSSVKLAADDAAAFVFTALRSFHAKKCSTMFRRRSGDVPKMFGNIFFLTGPSSIQSILLSILDS
jgi:hypothetical protein